LGGRIVAETSSGFPRRVLRAAWNREAVPPVGSSERRDATDRRIVLSEAPTVRNDRVNEESVSDPPTHG